MNENNDIQDDGTDAVSGIFALQRSRTSAARAVYAPAPCDPGAKSKIDLPYEGASLNLMSLRIRVSKTLEPNCSRTRSIILRLRVNRLLDSVNTIPSNSGEMPIPA